MVNSLGLTLWIKKFGVAQKLGMEKINLDVMPAPAIMAQGLGGVSHSQYWLEIKNYMRLEGYDYEDVADLDKPSPTVTAQGRGTTGFRLDFSQKQKLNTKMNKPAYQVPTIQEIQALPWNGFKVASTFSGCGGSCTGYRMAGFKVVWANEFVPAAQESYKANADADCYLDRRDIKNVQVEEIFEITGLKQGELDLFDGSPPCQAFSTAGKREKGWGKDKTYEHGAKQKNETLFDEYVRLLRGLKPKVFVAENVSGLLKGTAKGYFIEIITALKNSGYRVKCKLLDAQWLGVPQQRQRAIFIGVREDLNLDPVYPMPLSYNYSVREALPWIVRAMVRDGFENTKPTFDMANTPAACVTASGGSAYSSHEVEANPTFVKVFHKCGGFSRTECTDQPSPAITATQCRMIIEKEADISRYAIGNEWDKLKQGEQSEKYFSLIRTDETKPSPTIQASHGNSSLARVTHPTEKRKFTIAELKRICGFPDDFILTGSYAQQWERLGNSVPPVMMFHVAKTIRDEILVNIKRIEV